MYGFNASMTNDERNNTFIPYNIYLVYCGLLNPKKARQEANAMLENRFPEAQFRKHDPLDLVAKQSVMVSLHSHIHTCGGIMKFLMKIL
jgi:hypothetical protein